MLVELSSKEAEFFYVASLMECTKIGFFRFFILALNFSGALQLCQKSDIPLL